MPFPYLSPLAMYSTQESEPPLGTIVVLILLVGAQVSLS